MKSRIQSHQLVHVCNTWSRVSSNIYTIWRVNSHFCILLSYFLIILSNKFFIIFLSPFNIISSLYFIIFFSKIGYIISSNKYPKLFSIFIALQHSNLFCSDFYQPTGTKFLLLKFYHPTIPKNLVLKKLKS